MLKKLLKTLLLFINDNSSGERILSPEPQIKKDNLVIGLWLLKDKGSKLGFFGNGWTIPCLKLSEKNQGSENCSKYAKTGLTVENTYLSSLVGMISKVQEEEFIWETVLSTTEIN